MSQNLKGMIEILVQCTYSKEQEIYAKMSFCTYSIRRLRDETCQFMCPQNRFKSRNDQVMENFEQ